MSGYDHDYHYEDVYKCTIYATLEFPKVKGIDLYDQIHMVLDAINDGADDELDTSDIVDGIKETDGTIRIDVVAGDVVECGEDGPDEDPDLFVDYHWVGRASGDLEISVVSAHWGDPEYYDTYLYD